MPETGPNETKTDAASKMLASDPYSRTIGEQWKKNHGTQLLAFACLIFIVGTAFLLYRQNRFVPVEFPSGDLIGGGDPGAGSNSASASNQVIAGETASIMVAGASNDRGVLRIAIYNAAEGFNDLTYAASKAIATIQNGESKTSIAIDTLSDSFAIAVFHDENENGILDRNPLGIPTELYGFSNNARGLIGPPSYAKAKIDRPEAGQSIKITIR